MIAGCIVNDTATSALVSADNPTNQEATKAVSKKKNKSKNRTERDNKKRTTKKVRC